MNRFYHIYTEGDSKCFNESSDRINSLKHRVIINDACVRVTNSGLSQDQLVTKYPNYQIKNAAFKNYCVLKKWIIAMNVRNARYLLLSQHFAIHDPKQKKPNTENIIIIMTWNIGISLLSKLSFLIIISYRNITFYMIKNWMFYL